STSTAATSRRSNSRLPTTLNARDQPPAEVSDQRVSGLTGAVQRDAWASNSGVGGLGFAGTASNETVAAPAGLTTLADDEFQCGPRMPMLPGAWDLGTWDRGD
ncbi:hypothetical protein ACNJTC_15065, partial [Mycobacterium tuberculosis]